MDGKRDVRTYRVRQLPQHIDALETSKLLVSLDPRLGPVYNVKVLSLGRGISPWERPPTKTATIMFQSLPTCLDSDDTVWTLPGREHGYHRDVLIDVHFLDFTVLCEPPKALHDSPTYDCIAISGLASHPFGSWRTRKQLDFMWLRDQLPQDFQNIRPILYGFNSILTGHTSFQNIDDLASSLVAKLRSVGRQSFSANPIIFLAHSLGGIVLKRALLYLASGTDRDQVILKKVAAVIFFGVPNKGMDINNLLSIVSEEGTDHTLVSELGPSSPFLNDLEKQYNGIASLKNIRIVSVYETKKSPLVQIGMDGKLHRTDTHAVLVDRESARHSNSQQHDVFAINEDHSNMVKFSRDDENYRLIASCIYDLVNTADSSSSSYPSENTENLLQPGLTPETHLPAEIVRQPHWNHVHPSLQHFETFRHHLPKQHPGHLASKDEAWRLYVLYIHETMMASLELDEVAAREEAVSNAYESTFDWVFTDSKLGFRRWLQSANNVFWIAGKPGSGKSTLMKYIWHDARTQKTLGTSDRDVKLLKAKFFFHDRGSYAQKSFEGLLQSIIHQLLLQEPILKESVETVFIKRALTYQRPWSLEELEGAFDNILTQKTARVHIFLHLDALDEYDGSKEVLCHFIQKTTTLLPDSYTQIGICFASRPWNIFNDYFGQSPGLKIHEHTSKDMRTYAKAKIESRPPLHKLIKSLKRTPKHLTYESILTGIVSKAQGVFLWVALMIEDLLKQSSDGLRVESIPHILQSMPDRLEDFYERIVSKIPQEYRVETYVMLESVLRTRGNLSLRGLAMTLECAQPGSEHFPTCMDLCRLSMDTFDPENMARLVSSRCGGLLEVVQVNRPAKARSNDDLKFLFQLTNNTEDGEKEESLDSYVQFMHQTVKDYMRNPGLLQSIISHDSMRTINSGNGNTFLFRSCIVDKSCYYNGDFVHYGRAAEATTGISQRVFIDSVDRGSSCTCMKSPKS
ncbi:hypothetical protein FH972_024303 [Carpinus fangiana]|uniref:NACHT domain-containing protein n=1 Tax=Carpinus fangiana TaxID=176857 RepID=A0A5N6KYD9_9ROSI|nr:hypothetical protein FH972_024303 [Carpinus fangiana]